MRLDPKEPSPWTILMNHKPRRTILQRIARIPGRWHNSIRKRLPGVRRHAAGTTPSLPPPPPPLFIHPFPGARWRRALGVGLAGRSTVGPGLDGESVSDRRVLVMMGEEPGTFYDYQARAICRALEKTGAVGFQRYTPHVSQIPQVPAAQIAEAIRRCEATERTDGQHPGGVGLARRTTAARSALAHVGPGPLRRSSPPACC